MPASRNNRAVELPFGRTIYQSERGQGISSDSSYLVHTILEEEKSETNRLLELGSGNGIISIMLKHYRSGWDISGIEIQSELTELAKANALICDFEIDFSNSDIKEFCSERKYSLIVTNPPYLSAHSGKISPIYERAIARHEILCNLADIIRNMGRNLHDGGRGYMINLTARTAEIEKQAEEENMVLDKIFSNNSCSMSKTSIYRIGK